MKILIKNGTKQLILTLYTAYKVFNLPHQCLHNPECHSKCLMTSRMGSSHVLYEATYLP